MKIKKITTILWTVMMCVSLSSCEIPIETNTTGTEESTYITITTTTAENVTNTESSIVEETETTSYTEETELQIIEEINEESEEVSTEELKGIRPEFKEALDAYEEFFDDYCEIMKQYMENPLDMSLLTKYGEYMEKADEMDEKIEALDDGEMSDEELAYYLEVTGRVLTKMLEIYQ